MTSSLKTKPPTPSCLVAVAAIIAASTTCAAQRTYEFVGEGNPFFQDFFNEQVLATVTLNELPFTSDSITVDFGEDFPNTAGLHTLTKAENDPRTLSEVAPGVLGCTECSGGEFLEYRFTESVDINDGDSSGPVFFIVAATFTQSGTGTVFVDNLGLTDEAAGTWILAVPEPASITPCLIAALLGSAARRRR